MNERSIRFVIHDHSLQCAIRTASAMVITTYLAMLLHFDSPYWAVITVVSIMNPYVGATIGKGFFRIIATIAGAILGILLANLHWSNALSFLAVIFVVLFITHYFVLVTRYSYAFLLTGVTFLIVFGSLAIDAHQPSVTAGWRTTEITLGVICASVMSLLIFPKDAIADMKRYIQEALRACQHLLQNNLKKENAAEEDLKTLWTQIEAINTHFPIFLQELGLTPSQQAGIETLSATLAKLYQHCFAHRLTYRQVIQLEWLESIQLDFKPVLKALAHYFNHLSKAIRYQRPLKSSFNVEQSIQALLDRYGLLRQQGVFLQYPHRETHILYIALQSIQSLWEYALGINQAIAQLQLTSAELKPLEKPFITGKTTQFTFQHCTKMALSVTLAMALWLQTNWPGGLQGLISSFVVALPEYTHDIARKALLRIAGAFIGGAAGLLTLGLFHYSLWVLLAVIFTLGTVFSYITFDSKKYSYVGLQANIALALSLVQSGGPPTTIEPALMRLSGILLGIGATFVVTYLVWPQRPLPFYQKTLHEIKKILPILIEHILKPQDDDKSLSIDMTKLTELIAKCQTLQTAIEADPVVSPKQHKHYQEQSACLRELFLLTDNCHNEIDVAMVHKRAEQLDLNIKPQIEKVIEAVNIFCHKTGAISSNPMGIDMAEFQETQQTFGDIIRQQRKSFALPHREIAQLLRFLQILELYLAILSTHQDVLLVEPSP